MSLIAPRSRKDRSSQDGKITPCSLQVSIGSALSTVTSRLSAPNSSSATLVRASISLLLVLLFPTVHDSLSSCSTYFPSAHGWNTAPDHFRGRDVGDRGTPSGVWQRDQNVDEL